MITQFSFQAEFIIMISIIIIIIIIIMSRDSSVGIETVYRLDDRGSRVRFPAGAGNSPFLHRV
jgi:preprotein translocase subunit SecG